MLDIQGYVASWNLGAERIKGYKASEIIGKHFSVFYTPEDNSAQKPGRELQIAIREGRVEDEGWRVRKDGSLFWANVVITALRDSTGSLVGFGKVTRDMTERMQAQELLRGEVADRKSAQQGLHAFRNRRSAACPSIFSVLRMRSAAASAAKCTIAWGSTSPR